MLRALASSQFVRTISSPLIRRDFGLTKKQSAYIFTIFRAYSAVLQFHATLKTTGDYNMNQKLSIAYKGLCTEYYELDKPEAPKEALSYYVKQAAEAKGPILEPMCGSGRFLIPLVKKGFNVTGFDSSEHMLSICRKKCEDEGLTPTLSGTSFETFSSDHRYQLIFIPSGSFSLLTNQLQVDEALHTVFKFLENKGKFIFEVDTLSSVSEPQEVWKGHWIDKPNGSKLVLNTFSRFDLLSRINTILCRYELWEENVITKTEVEDFKVRLYGISELDEVLEWHGFKIINKYVPYTGMRPDAKSETMLYECVKK